MISFRDLAKIIDGMTDEQKDDMVSIYNQEIDEYFSAQGVGVTLEEDDVLDKGHQFIIFPDLPNAKLY
jgi:hypothetical protein